MSLKRIFLTILFILTFSTLGLSQSNPPLDIRDVAGHHKTNAGQLVFPAITVQGNKVTVTGAGGTVTSIGVTTSAGVSAVSDGNATSPKLTFTLGAILPTSVDGLTISTTTGTFTLTNGKVFSVGNTLTLTGTDGSTLNVGTGGTLGLNAFISTVFAPASRLINTSSPITGGGDLSADRTIACATCEVTGNKDAASGYAGLTAGSLLKTAEFPAFTGDITTTSGGVVSVLATVNGNVGTFGSATQSSQFTVNAKGLITAASNVTIAIAESQVTNLVSDLALKAPLASPTFTGTVVLPTPFTIGAVSMTATGTELNFVAGVTSAIQTQLNAKATDSLVAHLAGIESFTGAKTFTVDSTFSGSAIIISGNINAPTWTTNGVRIKGTPGTLTDTTAATGTTATAYTDMLGGNTIAATNAGVIFTNYFTQYNKDPVAGTNVSFTNKWALGADSAKIGTSNQVTISNTGVINATSPVFATNISTPAIITASGALTITPASNAAVLLSTTERIQVGGTTNHFQALRASTDSTFNFPMAIEVADDSALGYLKLNEILFQTGSFNTANATMRLEATSGSVQFGTGGGLKWVNASTITSNNPTFDVTLTRNAAGILQFGTTAANASGSWLATNGTLSGQLTDPLVIGGSAVGASLELRSTSGVGTTDFIKFTVGNNGGTEAMRVIDSGNVGIGATSPATFLHVKGGNVTNRGQLTLEATDFIQMTGYNGASTLVWSLLHDVTNNLLELGTKSSGGQLILLSGAFVEAARFDGSGNFKIATTTDSTTTTSGSLQVAGGAAIRKRVFIDGISASAGLQTAVLCQSSGGEMIADSVACLASSERFKEGIKPLASGLDEVMKLRPISYRYKPEGIFAGNVNFSRERVGFLAEDIDRIDPRFVGYEADGITPRTVGYDTMVPLLTRAIQQQQSEIDGLKRRIGELEKGLDR